MKNIYKGKYSPATPADFNWNLECDTQYFKKQIIIN